MIGCLDCAKLKAENERLQAEVIRLEKWKSAVELFVSFVDEEYLRNNGEGK